MKRLWKDMWLLIVGFLLLSFAIIQFARAQTGRIGTEGNLENPNAVAAVIVLQNKNPGWLPPGSLWISSNKFVFIQTNSWNTNLTVVYTNWSSVCLSNCAGGTNAVYTNILVSYYSNNVPLAGWCTNAAWGNGASVPN